MMISRWTAMLLVPSMLVLPPVLTPPLTLASQPVERPCVLEPARADAI